LRTVTAGVRALRRAPLAVLPLTLEGGAVGVLVLLGVFPSSAESAIAGALFPIDIYFDLKQSLAFSFSWPTFAASVVLSVLVRSGSLAATLWLADDRRAPIASVWLPAARLSLVAVAALSPVAVFMYLSTTLRYAPFGIVAAVAGLLVAVVFVRRALSLDGGAGRPNGAGVPEVGGFLAYAYTLCAVGAAMSSLDRISAVPVGLLLMCLGPLHALFLLGWREHLRAETYPGAGTFAVGVTGLATIVFLSSVVYDRAIHDPPPVASADALGTLLLLGGADSTSETGALTEMDPRDVGFDPESTRTLSYRGPDATYDAADTRGDLTEIARTVSRQIEGEPAPRLLLGHSQASLVIDRIIDADLVAPDRSVVLAPPPPVPPAMSVPPPGRDGPGRVGGDAARAVAKLFDLAGLPAFDIDAAASPTNLRPVVVIDKRVSRVSVWALGDSVWLDGDWRRPGEINLVAISDHVGIANNRRALEGSRRFLAGGSVAGDEVSWRGFLVSLVRYAFEPWRPG
jgi:hypothetical protein